MTVQTLFDYLEGGDTLDASLTGIGSELLVFGTAFIAKVWDKVETQYVDAVAKSTGPVLRDQIFAAAADNPVLHFDDFADKDPGDAKSQKQPLAADTLCTLAA